MPKHTAPFGSGYARLGFRISFGFRASGLAGSRRVVVFRQVPRRTGTAYAGGAGSRSDHYDLARWVQGKLSWQGYIVFGRRDRPFRQ